MSDLLNVDNLEIDNLNDDELKSVAGGITDTTVASCMCCGGTATVQPTRPQQEIAQG